MACPLLAEGDIIRITRVDNCGAPVEGAGNAWVDECWASVAMTPNQETGTDVKHVGANGKVCGFKRGRTQFFGFDVVATILNASPELAVMLTGNPEYDDFGGDAVGWDECGGSVEFGFALEIWQNVVGEDCPEDGDGSWFYWLIPWLENGSLGEITVAQEGVNLPFSANARAGGNWSLGPWDVQDNDGTGTAGPLLTEVGDECYRRQFLTTIAPPTPACSPILVPNNNIAPS